MSILRLALIACLVLALVCTLIAGGTILDAGMATWLIAAALCWALEPLSGDRFVIGPRAGPPVA